MSCYHTGKRKVTLVIFKPVIIPKPFEEKYLQSFITVHTDNPTKIKVEFNNSYTKIKL